MSCSVFLYIIYTIGEWKRKIDTLFTIYFVLELLTIVTSGLMPCFNWFPSRSVGTNVESFKPNQARNNECDGICKTKSKQNVNMLWLKNNHADLDVVYKLCLLLCRCVVGLQIPVEMVNENLQYNYKNIFTLLVHNTRTRHDSMLRNFY